MDGAFEFLEEKPKTDVKKFLPLLGMLKKAFPETRVIISKARMIEDFIEAGIDPGKVDSVKGYTDGNIVVLNPGKLDYETPIHEFGHLWAQATRQLRPDLYTKGVELIRKSPYWIEIQEKAKDKNSVYYGYDTSRMQEEAMATMIGQAGSKFFTEQQDVKAWDKLRNQIWDWINAKLGIKKVEDLTYDQFAKLAVTEILTGERFITEGQQELIDNSLIYNALQVPVGATRDYTPSTKPAAEIDTHGVFNGKALKKEALNTANKYWDELQNGGWIGYTTGDYGDHLVGTSKWNPKVNAKIESKVRGLREEFAKEGLSFMRDPKNPGFHIVKKAPTLSFLESVKAPIKSLVNKRDQLALDSHYYQQLVNMTEGKKWTKGKLNAVDTKELNRLSGIIESLRQETSDAEAQQSVEDFKKAKMDQLEDAKDRLDTIRAVIAQKRREASEKRTHAVKEIQKEEQFKNESIADLFDDYDSASETGYFNFLEESPQSEMDNEVKDGLIKSINRNIKSGLAPRNKKSAYLSLIHI